MPVKLVTSEKMKTKFGMQALILLLVVALAGAIFVPAVSAGDENNECPDTSQKECTDQIRIGNLTLPLINSEIISIDLEKYNEPMTKMEFEKANEEYIKFLHDQFGDKAEKMIDEEYSKYYSSKAKGDIIIHVGSYDIYLWPCLSRQTNTASNSGPVNAIFLNTYVREISSFMQDDKGWGNAFGFTEYGLHGSNPNDMVWTSSTMGGYYQLQDGSYLGNRYHLVLVDGHHSSSLNDDWCYGNCHYEFWTGSGHELFPDSIDDGRDHLYNEISNDASASWINLRNPWDGFFDGWGYIFDFD